MLHKSVKSTYRNAYLPCLGGLASCGLAGALLVATPSPARALSLYSGPSGLEIDLNTTVSYTPIFRVGNPSKALTGPANANGSEGDLDFQHGLVSNRFDLLPVLDIKDGDFGGHFSGEAYLNTSYLGTNQNNQPDTLNPLSVAKNTDFTSATRNVEGENARVLDAFVYGTQHFGADQGQSLTVKVGRQTLLWGQSLFLAGNGIAAGMAPDDIVTADNNPNAETQQIIEPTGQVVVTYQPNDIVTLQAYYQFEWAHDYFEGVGAYFNSSDLLDRGGQRLLLPPAFGGNVPRGKDRSPPTGNGQFGLGTQLTLGNYDVGIYGLRFDAKAPEFLLVPTKAYYAVYPRDIWIEGASISTTVGPANVAGEISFRQHMPLVAGLTVPSAGSNENSNPAYPVGDTWAAQVSTIYVTPPVPFVPDGIALDGEIGMNHVLSVTANKAALTNSPLRSSTAAQLQGLATLNYYDVVPNLNIGVPVGLAYTFYGRSQISGGENHGTGTANIGVTATYKVTWVASITYNDFIGAANPLLGYEPSLADRSYVLLNFQHSF